MSFVGTQSRPDLGRPRAGLGRRIGAVASPGTARRARPRAWRASGRRKPDGILGRQHAEHEIERQRRRLLGPFGGHARQRHAAILVVPAVEPELAAGRQRLDQRPARQASAAAPASRPGASPRAIAASSIANRAARSRSMQATAVAGIVDLVRAGQRRRRQVERPAVALVAEAAGARRRPAIRGPCGTAARRASAASRRDDLAAASALAADHRRHAGLQDAGLLAGDRRRALSPRKPVWS